MHFRYFTIVGSKILRRNSKYHVSVTSTGYEEPQTLSISVVKYVINSLTVHDRNESSEIKKLVTLSGDQTEIVEFDVSSI